MPPRNAYRQVACGLFVGLIGIEPHVRVSKRAWLAQQRLERSEVLGYGLGRNLRVSWSPSPEGAAVDRLEFREA
jgi:hypothetical protein